VPLMLIALAFAMDDLALSSARAKWSAVLFLWLPFRTVATVNLDHTMIWPEQSIPTRFFEKVNEREPEAGRTLIIGGHHQSSVSWPLNARMAGVASTNLQTEDFPQGDHDLRLVDQR